MKSDRLFPLNIKDKGKYENMQQTGGQRGFQLLKETTIEDNSYVDILHKLGLQKRDIKLKKVPELKLNNQIDKSLQSSKKDLKSSRHQIQRNYTPIGHHELKDKYIHHYAAKDESMSELLKQNFERKDSIASSSFQHRQSQKQLFKQSQLMKSQKAFITDGQNSERDMVFTSKPSLQDLSIFPKISVRQVDKASNLNTHSKVFKLDHTQTKLMTYTNPQSPLNRTGLNLNLESRDRSQLRDSPSFMTFFKDSRKELMLKHKQHLQKSSNSSRKNLFNQISQNRSQFIVDSIRKSSLASNHKTIDVQNLDDNYQQDIRTQARLTIGSHMNSQKRLNKLKLMLKRNNVSPRVAEDTRARRLRGNSKMIDGEESIDKSMAKLMYKGKEIVTYKDILKEISLFPPDQQSKQEMKELSQDFFDPKYLELINQQKPKKDYFKESLGDKLLFLSKIDTIEYDILDEERKKQAILLRSKLDNARNEKQLNHTINI
eukprot:403352053